MKHEILTFDTEINGERVVWIIVEGNYREIVGCAQLKIREAALIVDLFVEAESRGQGIAHQIIERCKQIVMKEKCTAVSLIVKKDSKVRALYEHLGFFPAFQWDDGDKLFTMKL